MDQLTIFKEGEKKFINLKEASNWASEDGFRLFTRAS